ncbi:MAG: TrkH family potassium uptake protein [Alphaproteobacteria bacterium]
MRNIRPVVLVLGILLISLGAVMLVPALFDLALEHRNWEGFAVAAGATLFTGIGLTIATWGPGTNFSVQQAFLMTTGAWVVLALFAALPLTLIDANLSFTDAFFEAMSGLTTTGSTVITGLDTMSHGMLLWRGLLQWLGGIGIIVMAIAILPLLQVGGMQMFRVEAFDAREKTHPRAAQFSAALSLIYIGLTAICATAYRLAGLSPFDAVVHAMTTIATGGFSNYDTSLGYFDSTAVEMVAIVFMIVGSLPFLLYIRAFQGRVADLFRDSQVRSFFLAIVLFSLLALASQFQGQYGVEHGLREAVFNVVSLMTGTGYATVDYDNWGPFAVVLLFFVTFVGGCAGSTSCGIKIFRFEVLFKHMRVQLERLSYPNGVFTPRYGGRPIPARVSRSVMAFFLLFFVSFGVLTAVLSVLGLDTLTAFSAAASALANVGPGLGDIVGPAGNFSSLPDPAKWALAAGMLVGRLELFTVLVLFVPAFWRG